MPNPISKIPPISQRSQRGLEVSAGEEKMGCSTTDWGENDKTGGTTGLSIVSLIVSNYLKLTTARQIIITSSPWRTLELSLTPTSWPFLPDLISLWSSCI